MFEVRVSRSRLHAAFAMMEVIFHIAANSVRSGHTNALASLFFNIIQTLTLVAVFYFMSVVLGLRGSAIRGDFLVYLLSGIFIFVTQIKTINAVQNSGLATSSMLLHAPLNTFVLIMSTALSMLYIQVLSVFIVLGIYDMIAGTVEIEDPASTFGMLLLAWFNGLAIGVLFLSLKPWSPRFISILSTFYTRANMFTSGKMFVANTLPTSMLMMFYWNPLFHIIDQARGFAFINYSPHRSSLAYPVICSIALLIIGFLIENNTRKSASASWGARQ